jgi:uncharacterized protein
MQLQDVPAVDQATKNFQAFIEDREFPCVGAKSAMGRGQTAFWRGGNLLDGAADRDLLAALYRFIRRYRRSQAMFTSFVAIFDGPLDLSEEGFEQALWRRLGALHRLDRRRHAWDARVSPDPASPLFGFSLLSEACFVVGLHGRASRTARRFERPTLVFNLHDQFERLRAEGRFDGLRTAIRKREAASQGAANPMLASHGEISEARQYSGRQVGADWRCPFRPAADAA